MAACERVAYFRSKIEPEPAETLAALGVALKVVSGEICEAPIGTGACLVNGALSSARFALPPCTTGK